MRGSWWLVMAGLLTLLAGCSSSSGPDVPAGANGPPVTFVVVGGDEALALVRRDQVPGSWPQLVFREALPLEATYVNLARGGFSLVGATDALGASFAELRPDVIAVWAGAADAASGRPVGEFRAALDGLVTLATRKPGSTVLLATLPAGPSDYNDAIREVADRRSLRLVELSGLVPAGTTDLSPEQNRAIADAFIAAYRSS
jgi:GDSL-like Lipase/Acylhydrolase family